VKADIETTDRMPESPEEERLCIELIPVGFHNRCRAFVGGGERVAVLGLDRILWVILDGLCEERAVEIQQIWSREEA
jgi:hypothetical protein